MTQQTVDHRIGDELTPLSFTLQQRNEGDTAYTAADLTGLTVKAFIEDKDGVQIVAPTTTGVDVTTAASGQVDYTMQGDITTAGKYYIYFQVISGANVDTYPVKKRDFEICAY